MHGVPRDQRDRGVVDTPASGQPLVVVGFHTGISVGDSLGRAARSLGIATYRVDARKAFDAPMLVRAACWHLAGRRPPALHALSNQLVRECARRQPRWMLATGIAPITANALKAIGALGVKRLNFLTDDPWNRALGSAWFFDALRQYDLVFSPRRSNLDDLRRHGCKNVQYLPFGFDPTLSFPDVPASADELSRYASDVVFVGGGDSDRLEYATALIKAGFRVALYGGYWDRFEQTRPYSRGLADMATIRRATTAARVALCLTRRANRDGHVMRSLEIAATGACMLVEDSIEHRELFGPPGETVVYFGTTDEMVARLRWLLNAESERQRLAGAVYERIVNGEHQYADRLRSMLTAAENSLAAEVAT